MRSASSYSLDDTLDVNDQADMIMSAGIMMEDDSKGDAQQFNNRHIMNASQSWNLASLMNIDMDTEEIVVVDVEDETDYAGYDLEFTGDLVMYAKDGQRDEIEYDIMRPRWSSTNSPKRVRPEGEIRELANTYLERAEDRL